MLEWNVDLRRPMLGLQRVNRDAGHCGKAKIGSRITNARRRRVPPGEPTQTSAASKIRRRRISNSFEQPENRFRTVIIVVAVTDDESVLIDCLGPAEMGVGAFQRTQIHH